MMCEFASVLAGRSTASRPGKMLTIDSLLWNSYSRLCLPQTAAYGTGDDDRRNCNRISVRSCKRHESIREVCQKDRYEVEATDQI